MNWTFLPAARFPEFAVPWQRLCEEFYAGHPFLDARFVGAALDAFADESVSIAVADDDPTAGLALIRRRSRLVVETFCPSQLPMALVLCGVEGRMDDDMLLGLLRSAGGQLLGVLHYDELFQLPVCNTTGTIEAVDYAPTMNVTLDCTFDAYWSTRSKNLRRNISRYQNRATRDNFEVVLEEITSGIEMQQALTAYGEIESAGWKGKQGSAISADNDQGRFYLDLMERFATRGGARVFHLRMNDKIVASRLVVQAGDTAVILKTTYDEGFARYSPGRVQLYLVLKELFADKTLNQVEFYTKAGADQQQWATGTRMIRHLNVYRRRSLAQLGALARRLRQRRRKNEEN